MDFDNEKLYTAPTVEVEWDNVVQHNLKPCYHGATRACIPIRLLDLLIKLGSIRPKRLNATLNASLADFEHLIYDIDDSADLKLKTHDIISQLGSEELGEVSELLGLGLSVVVISELFDIQPSTVNLIKGTKKRPDWKCLLNDGRTLIIESKGSTNKYNSKKQLKEGIEQKRKEPGDISVVAASLLNENTTSKMTIIDPPVNKDNNQNNMLRHIYRANHYASVFSFLGEDILSLYFEKMAKRLSCEIREAEMEDKELMYDEFLRNSPSVILEGKEYSGHLYGPFENSYIFIGVNKALLPYNGFLRFVDSDKEKIVEKRENQYFMFPDGILVVNVGNLDSFREGNSIESIGVGYDNIALSDIDSIRGMSFKRYVKYLLDKSFGGSEATGDGGLRINDNGKERLFYFYHISNTKGKYRQSRTIRKMVDYMEGRTGVLVTNAKVSQSDIGFQCVNRDDFEAIAALRANVDVVREIFSR